VVFPVDESQGRRSCFTAEFSHAVRKLIDSSQSQVESPFQQVAGSTLLRNPDDIIAVRIGVADMGQLPSAVSWGGFSVQPKREPQ